MQQTAFPLRWASLGAMLLFVGFSASLAAQEPTAEPAGAVKWKSLGDGKTLGKWQVLDKPEFEGHGRVHVKQGCIILEQGAPATGIRWKGDFPRMDYEVALEGRRVEGSDFFCGLTFPVGDKAALTLILGGWGGWVVGLSCIDGYYAIDNETCQAVEFEQGRWYRVRVRVSKSKVEVYLDDKRMIELETENRKLAVSVEMAPCQPLGIATWNTTGAIRKIRYRSLTPAAGR